MPVLVDDPAKTVVSADREVIGIAVGCNRRNTMRGGGTSSAARNALSSGRSRGRRPVSAKGATMRIKNIDLTFFNQIPILSWLTSDKAAHLTGVELPVDAGSLTPPNINLDPVVD